MSHSSKLYSCCASELTTTIRHAIITTTSGEKPRVRARIGQLREVMYRLQSKENSLVRN